MISHSGVDSSQGGEDVSVVNENAPSHDAFATDELQARLAVLKVADCDEQPDMESFDRRLESFKELIEKNEKRIAEKFEAIIDIEAGCDYKYKTEELEYRRAHYDRLVKSHEVWISQLERYARSGFYSDYKDFICAFCGFNAREELQYLIPIDDIFLIHCARNCSVALGNK